jgi:hypothetical protein
LSAFHPTADIMLVPTDVGSWHFSAIPARPLF